VFEDVPMRAGVIYITFPKDDGGVRLDHLPRMRVAERIFWRPEDLIFDRGSDRVEFRPVFALDSGAGGKVLEGNQFKRGRGVSALGCSGTT
jgi:hypothetical protein